MVDDYATATHSSYLAARVSMAQEEAGVRQEFISALFSAQGRLPETRDRFAKAFNLKPDVPYAIAAASFAGDTPTTPVGADPPSGPFASTARVTVTGAVPSLR